jgi:hypothetical protein
MTREEKRDAALRGASARYNPWLHLLGPSAVGVAIVAASLALLRDLRLHQLATVPLTVLGLNLAEWAIHREFMHARRWPLGVLHDRHADHHAVFHEDDMAVRSPRELWLVLMPGFAIVAAFVASLPIPVALAAAGASNAAALFAATTMSYLVSYELLHASYHAPPDTPFGRSRVVGALRRWHARHHAPRLMQWKNFNVTLPIGDVVFRTAAPRKFTPLDRDNSK